MLFNSIDFLIYFPTVVFGYYLMPKRVRNIFLLLASYYFYMQWNAKYFILIGISTVVTFGASRLMGQIGSEDSKKRRRYLIYSLVINLGILFTFKYYGLFAYQFNRLLSVFTEMSIPPTLNLLLPVGISFYTFQALSYTIDVYRGDIKPERNFIDYALFVSFFPQLVAGPIERSGRLLTQIKKESKFTMKGLVEGGFLMVFGFFLKLVIADRIAIIVNAVFAQPMSYSGNTIALAATLFSFQLYCDFYSYSIIAKGAARVLDIRLMDNFRQPFFATSIKELWHRWHISLSTWFRDYLYIPLGGSRLGKTRTYLNVMIVFLLSGLWHGAEMSFVVWGGLHGAFQVLGSIKDSFMGNRFRQAVDGSKILRVPRMLFTFALFTISMYFFRASTYTDAVSMISRTLNDFQIGRDIISEVLSTGISLKSLNVLWYSLLVLFIFSIFKEYRNDIEMYYAKLPYLVKVPVILAILFAVIIFGIYGPGFSESQFIYFQF